MKIHLWGTDFRRSDKEFRRQLYIEPQELKEGLLRIMDGFSDLVYLNTCNRIEFYTTAKDYYTDTRTQWVSMLSRFNLTEDAYYLGYQLEGKSALRHLLRVASSLESLVIGEPQILGQLKECVRSSIDFGIALSPSIKRAFQLAFETARVVRSTTDIGTESVSVASLGMEQMKILEGDYPLRSAVVVGRSPMSVVVVNWLKKNRPEIPIRWVNRNPELLQRDSASLGTEIIGLYDFLGNPGSFSHLFTSTGSSTPLFDDHFFSRIDSPYSVAFDFSEPPDISHVPETSKTKVVRLEDLKLLAGRNRDSRRSAVMSAEKIIDTAIKDFFQEQKETPVLRDFSVLEPVLLKEAHSAVDELGSHISKDELRIWAEKLVKKNLHTSRMQLKSILKIVAESEQVQSGVLEV